MILKSVYKQGLRRAEQSPTQTTFKCCYAIPFFMYIMDQIDIFCKHAGISHYSLKESLVLVNFPSQLVVSGFKTKNIENNHCQHMSSSHCAKPNQLYAPCHGLSHDELDTLPFIKCAQIHVKCIFCFYVTVSLKNCPFFLNVSQGKRYACICI